MKLPADFTKKYFVKIVIFSYLISRIFIFAFPPPEYSDVSHDYERYANTWRYGLMPYREILYEYPPISIPLLVIPLELDQMGIGKFYPNFRLQVWLIDAIFVFTLYKVTAILPWTKRHRLRNLLLFFLLGMIGKDFYFDGLDLVFSSAMYLAIFSVLWQGKQLMGQVATWTLYAISVGVKFLTLPMLLPLGLATNRKLPLTLATFVIGVLLIWSLPLLIYRSSLSVSIVHNLGRPIKYTALPTQFIRLANVTTQSETQVNLAPDFQYVGPVSELVTKIVSVTFPLSMLTWVGLCLYHYRRLLGEKGKWSIALLKQWVLGSSVQLNREQQVAYLLQAYGLFMILLFLFAKLFSKPFHIWYFPMLVVFPFHSDRHFKEFFAIAVFLAVLDMTMLLHFHEQLKEISPYLPILKDMLIFAPMPAMFWYFHRGAQPKELA